MHQTFLIYSLYCMTGSELVGAFLWTSIKATQRLAKMMTIRLPHC